MIFALLVVVQLENIIYSMSIENYYLMVISFVLKDEIRVYGRPINCTENPPFALGTSATTTSSMPLLTMQYLNLKW